MKHSLCLFIVILGLLPLGASAQWAWTDKDGRKVFSDRAPSADVPDKSIFKRPGSGARLPSQDLTLNSVAGEPATKTSAPTSEGSKPNATGVDKDLAERKKKEEQAQAALRKAEEDRITKAKADNCQRARLAQKGLDSGVRIGRINSQGEREIMDDAARAAEAKRIQAIVESDCK
ncbi:MAG: DUF4124 domain-containing protein [Rhodoferax sp.]|uniref:DUF4124 domain-containing protein n=1 Tax=Rhodoferax sp. TaxID=50421 RepID=UPI00260B8F7C|nr:DUF4124 domain-containing protein [Rhodoferax sp.]MDD2879189.1 DUF4124 domain-containing protein [Rhodoferax sp.]